MSGALFLHEGGGRKQAFGVQIMMPLTKLKGCKCNIERMT